MKRLVVAMMAVVLTACSTVPNYRSLAKRVVPTNVELIGTIYNYISEERTDKAYCSGVAITQTHLITAGHCVNAARLNNDPEGRALLLFDGKIKIRLQDGKVVLATIVAESFIDEAGAKDSRDVAFLMVDEPVLTPAVIGNSDELAVGDQVAIVGNSFGELKHSFTIGVVSYIVRELNVGTFIQTDALSAGGNSGGPVFNMKGELIGILVRGGGGISLALPINDVLRQLNDVIKAKK